MEGYGGRDKELTYNMFNIDGVLVVSTGIPFAFMDLGYV